VALGVRDLEENLYVKKSRDSDGEQFGARSFWSYDAVWLLILALAFFAVGSELRDIINENLWNTLS
jgi:hypothetical protein